MDRCGQCSGQTLEVDEPYAWEADKWGGAVLLV